MPKPPGRGTSRVQRPGTRPTPPKKPAGSNTGLFAIIGVVALAGVVGGLYAAGVFGGPDLNDAKRRTVRLCSEGRALLEEGNPTDALKKYQAGVDHLAGQNLGDKLPEQMAELQAGIEKCKADQTAEKAAREKWLAWKAKTEKTNIDHDALLKEADTLAPLFSKRPWAAQFAAARESLKPPEKPAVSWEAFLAELEKGTQYSHPTDGRWGDAMTALNKRREQVPADGTKIDALIKDIDRTMQRIFTELMLESERMKKKGEDAVKFLTDRRPQFAGTHAEIQYDELIETIRKK